MAPPDDHWEDWSTIRIPIPHIATACLILISISTSACAAGEPESPGSSDTTDELPTAAVEVLTAEQVLVLARTALNSVTSYRGNGETRIEFDERDPEVSRVALEWASPDLLRHESHTADSNAARQESIESITIGTEQYLRGSYHFGPASTIATWHQGPDFSGRSNLVMSSLDIAGPVITGVLSLDGQDVYRIEGTQPAVIDPVPALGGLRTDGGFALFVDALSFRPVRIEQNVAVSGYRLQPGSGIVPRFVLGIDRLAFTATTVLDFEYVEEPIVIERPVVFPTPTRRRR